MNKIRVPTGCILSVETVPMGCILSVGTVPTGCILAVGTVPTDNLSQELKTNLASSEAKIILGL